MRLGFIGIGKMGGNMVLVLKADPKLEALKDYVEDSGEGRWTILSATAPRQLDQCPD